MIEGLYEQLITQLVLQQINDVNKDTFFINKTTIDKEEASLILSQHLSKTIRNALNLISGDKQIERQIEIANKIILLLKEELKNEEFNGDLIEIEGEILKAVFSKVDAHFTDINLYLKGNYTLYKINS
jgi:hypothetical protein